MQTAQHTEHASAIDAAPEPFDVEAAIERVKATAKGPCLPDLLVPQDNTSAMIALLADGHGSIPAFLRKHEPAAFDCGIRRLWERGFELELRGGTHYYLKAQHGPGSVLHLRELLDTDVDTALYRDYCSRELHAWMDRLQHYELCRGIAGQRAKKAARTERQEANSTDTDGEHANG